MTSLKREKNINSNFITLNVLIKFLNYQLVFLKEKKDQKYHQSP